MASARYYGTGRRKKSIARVYVTPGTGKITINKRDIDEYFGLETLKVIVRQPLAALDDNRQIRCTRKCTRWWIHRTGWSNPSRIIKSFTSGRCRLPSGTQESRLLNKRPKNERKKEIRSQISSSCSTVLKEIIFQERRYQEKPILQGLQKLWNAVRCAGIYIECNTYAAGMQQIY